MVGRQYVAAAQPSITRTFPAGGTQLRAQTDPSAAGWPPADVPGPGAGRGSGPEIVEGENRQGVRISRRVPLVRELLQLYGEGGIAPAPVQLGPLRDDATEPMRRIAADIELRLGLLLAEGVTRALPYATTEAIGAGFVRTKGGASYALRRLVDDGVIVCVGEMPKRGRGNGTKLYVPPGWRPVRSGAVELADDHRLADLVWRPDEPGLGAVAVEPDMEVGDELLDAHGSTHVEHTRPSTGGDSALLARAERLAADHPDLAGGVP